MKNYLNAKGMVFGVFDGLHEGHTHFLREARKLCEQLIVVVAPVEAAFRLKSHAPLYSNEDRVRAVHTLLQDAEVVLGDKAEGEWLVLKTHAPDFVILGYDQQAIAVALDARGIPYTYLSAHEPEKFKSSILNRAKPEGGKGG